MSLQDLILTVHAGPHDRHDCPVFVELPEPLPAKRWSLSAHGDPSIPLEPIQGKQYAFVLRHLSANTTRTYRILEASSRDDTAESDLDRDRAEKRAQSLGLPFVDLSVYKPDQSALNALPEAFIRRQEVLPIKKQQEILFIAMPDMPNEEFLWSLEREAGCSVRPVLAVPQQIALAMERLYGSDDSRGGHSNAVEPAAPQVRIDHEAGSHIGIYLYGSLLTHYVYGNVPARPYFFPLIAPGGAAVTRSYPIKTDVSDETHDHPHHKSLWISHGDVNGTDNWSEEEGHGYTRQRSIDLLASGNACGRFTTTSEWATRDDDPLLTQHLTVTAWATEPDRRLIDFDIRLTASYGDVRFGDTKEGGILAARVASALDVPRGGRIETAYGGIDEAESWGRSAHWCDYSGHVGGRHVGIAILDHPTGFRHPTHWHVRNYGLMTANPFGYAAFTGGRLNGSYLLKSGEALEFHYRVVLHTGDAAEGEIKNRYIDYACPPIVKVSGDGG